MAYTIPRQQVIDYPASALRGFHVYGYEWIDDLHFIHRPEEFIPHPADHVAIVKERFLEVDWDGDGEIGLLWLPPFIVID